MNELVWQQPGQQLIEAASNCRRDAVLVAPFIKRSSLARILKPLPNGVRVRCVTRWYIDEIATGVSDLSVWDEFEQRTNGELWLVPALHAKYYRYDDVIWVGSANLTAAALGWSATPNLELITPVADTAALSVSHAFEKELFSAALRVTQEIYERYCSALDLYQKSVFDAAPNSRDARDKVEASALSVPALARPVRVWLPSCRTPELLFAVYRRGEANLSRAALSAANDDLSVLDLPPRLTEQQFNAVVAARLSVLPLIMQLDEFVATSQRFGAVRSWLQAAVGLADATETWQTLMRWLLYFLPARYQCGPHPRSEVFGRRL